MKVIKRDFKKEPLQVLSYGGGVQSTAMIFLMIEGKLPIPDIIIHSDTGSEMPYTEDIILDMKIIVENKLGIPFEIVTAKQGKLHEAYYEKNSVPVVGIRSCTVNFKILPQRRKIREIVGKGNGILLAECWLGITTDESKREVQTDLKWIGNKFPLLELNYSRNDCIQINKKYNFEVKKSGCFVCPYGGKKWFIKLYQDHPDLFEICLELEKNYQKKYGKKHGLVPSLSNIESLQIPSLFTFGGEIIQENQSNCSTGGGCFL